jgi:hypothetical protein
VARARVEVAVAFLCGGGLPAATRLYLAKGWRTGLPRLVLLLQVGNAVNFFGYGLILPSRSSTCTSSAASGRPPPASCLPRSWGRAQPRRREGPGAVFTTSHGGHQTTWVMIDHLPKSVRYSRVADGLTAGTIAIEVLDSGKSLRSGTSDI